MRKTKKHNKICNECEYYRYTGSHTKGYCTKKKKIVQDNENAKKLKSIGTKKKERVGNDFEFFYL